MGDIFRNRCNGLPNETDVWPKGKRLESLGEWLSSTEPMKIGKATRVRLGKINSSVLDLLCLKSVLNIYMEMPVMQLEM